MSCRSQLTVEGDALFVTHAVAAEDVEGGTDGKVHAAMTGFSNLLQIFQGPCATRIGGRDGGPLAEAFHEFQVDALTKAFDIDGVDQKFIAGVGERLERLLGDT